MPTDVRSAAWELRRDIPGPHRRSRGSVGRAFHRRQRMSPDQPRDEGGRFTSEGSVSLRDHVDALLSGAKELQSEKWAGHEENHELIALALKTQAGENDERLKTMNEWRGTVGDLTAKFVTRETLDSVLKSVAADARARQQWMMTFTLAASGLAVAVATLILRLSGNP